MAFPRIVQQGLFDWIEANLAADKPAPTDAEIMDHWGLRDITSARSLLADLADAGRISIQWADGGRTVSLGKRAPAACPSAQPLASVVRRDGAGERIRVNPNTVLDDPYHIRKARETAPQASSARPLEAAASEGEQPAAEQARIEPASPKDHRAGKEGRGQPAPPLTQQGAATPGEAETLAAGNVAKPQVDPEPDRVDHPAGEPSNQKRASRTEWVSFGVRLTPADYQRLGNAAHTASSTTAAHARTLILAALTPPEPSNVVAFEPGKKPFVSAAMIRAAREAGQPLDVFVTAMLARGFAAWRADAGRSAAA